MPEKGKAFEKPGINYFHKAGSAKAAQAKAAAAATGQAECELTKELTDSVSKSKICDERKAAALKEISEALEKLRAGVDPLSGLNPPPKCFVCAGNRKGTHLFLCQSRRMQPSGPERALRSSVINKLSSAWRKYLYAKQASSSSVRALPAIAPSKTSPRLRARALRQFLCPFE